MKKFIHIYIILFPIILLFVSQNSLGQNYAREFKDFSLIIENNQVWIQPKGMLFSTPNSQNKVNVADFVTFSYSRNTLIKEKIDQDNKIYTKTYKDTIIDTTYILKEQKSKLCRSCQEDKIDFLYFNYYNYVLKKVGNELIIFIPKLKTEVEEYYVFYTLDNQLEPTESLKERKISYTPAKLIILDITNNTIKYEFENYDLININENGISVLSSEKDHKEFSFINLNGTYLYKNIPFSEWTSNDMYLKTIIGNCQNISNKEINIEDKDIQFKYQKKDKTSGFFRLSENIVYDIELYISNDWGTTGMGIDNNRIFRHGVFYIHKNVFKIIEADTIIDTWEYEGILQTDTTYIKADTILSEVRSYDTLIYTDNYIATWEDPMTYYLYCYIDNVNKSNGEQILDLNFTRETTIIKKRGKTFYLSSPYDIRLMPVPLMIRPDPNDRDTWYDSIDYYTGRTVMDTSKIWFDKYNIGKTLVYNSETKKMKELNGYSLQSWNKHGVLFTRTKWYLNIPYMLGQVNNENYLTEEYIYYTYDSINSVIKDSFYVNQIINDPKREAVI